MMRAVGFAVAVLVLCLGTAYAALPFVAPHWKASIEQRLVRLVGQDELMREGRGRLDARMQAVHAEAGSPVFIRIFKEEAELELWARPEPDGPYVPVHTYPVCYFSGPLGPKQAEGDGMSPEGFYAVTAKQMLPTSRYHRAFNLAFPNAYDRARGRTGSYLMVHGDCVSIGCYAMTDAGISEIYLAVEDALQAGQSNVPVHIFPFRMTAERMAQSAGPWKPFWENLREGYGRFEAQRLPPEVGVRDRRYVFDDPEGQPVEGW